MPITYQRPLLVLHDGLEIASGQSLPNRIVNGRDLAEHLFCCNGHDGWMNGNGRYGSRWMDVVDRNDENQPSRVGLIPYNIHKQLIVDYDVDKIGSHVCRSYSIHRQTNNV